MDKDPIAPRERPRQYKHPLYVYLVEHTKISEEDTIRIFRAARMGKKLVRRPGGFHKEYFLRLENVFNDLIGTYGIDGCCRIIVYVVNDINVEPLSYFQQRYDAILSFMSESDPDKNRAIANGIDVDSGYTQQISLEELKLELIEIFGLGAEGSELLDALVEQLNNKLSLYVNYQYQFLFTTILEIADEAGVEDNMTVIGLLIKLLDRNDILEIVYKSDEEIKKVIRETM